MAKKYKISEVKHILKEYNLTMIDEKEYKNSKSKINVIDDYGYKYLISFSNFIGSNKKIERFAKYNPYSIDNINNYIKINKLNNKILSNNYTGNQSKYIFTCNKCGGIYETTWNDFLSHNRILCKKCSGGYKRSKKSLEEITSTLKEFGYEILYPNEYINSKSKITLCDKYNYKYYISFSDMVLYNKENNKPDKFSKYNKYTIDNIKNYLTINNYNNKLISNKYINCDEPLIFTCESCGKEYSVTLKHLIHSKQTRCKECTKCKSINELLTEKYLNDKRIKFIEQYKFDDCKDKIPLPFDFAIFDEYNNIKLLIECDGEQHYKPVNFFGKNYKSSKECFEITKKHDNIKDNYCKSKDIKLLRICYKDFDNKNYINILNDNL